MGMLYYVSYVAILVIFAFITLSLASGLLYISELIEEHSRLAKIVGQRGIYTIIALHVLFYLTDSLPFLQTIFSITCHLVYLQNFSSTWPLISLSSLSFVGSCVLVIVDHFMWFFYFAHLTQGARQQRYRGHYTPSPPSFTEIATFFGICVWLAPLFLFLSLSANDNALPTSMSNPDSPSATATQFPRQRVSLFRSILSFLPSRGRKSEGIIAPPQSPVPKVYHLNTPSIGGPSHIPSTPPPRSSISRKLFPQVAGSRQSWNRFRFEKGI
uniref:DUF396-domain-containing protein n=1 Tax=Moniliophthora roreri TaxID=221103 RepID=A0A0W0EZC7_MONRR